MRIRQIPVSLASLVVVLAGINFIGVDPADIAIVAVVPLLLAWRPALFALTWLSLGTRVIVAMFLASYAVSAAINPVNLSFLLNFLSNLLFFFCIYFIATSRPPHAHFGQLVMLGFFVPLLLQLVLMVSPVPQLAFLFEAVRDTRFLGMLGDPNLTALHAIVAALLMIDDLLLSRRLPLSPAVKGSLLAVAILVLFATQSRSAWLAFAVALPVYVLTARQLFSIKRLGIAALLVAVLAVVTLGALQASGQSHLITQRFQSVAEHDSQAEQDRFDLVFTAAALAVGIQNPLGAGPGMSITATGIDNADGQPIGAHNAFVQIFADNGWTATVALLMLLVWTLARLTRLARAGVVYLGVPCRVMLCALVATCVIGMFHDLLSWRIAWLMPSLAVLSSFSRPPRARHHAAVPARELPVVT